jgi:hypothetical protein
MNQAVESLRRKNGSVRPNGHDAHNGNDGNNIHNFPEVFRDPSALTVPGQPPIKSVVISSWCRELAIINHDGWGFQIRDTMHHSIRGADVITLSLNRNDLESLKRGIEKVLADSPTRA